MAPADPSHGSTIEIALLIQEVASLSESIRQRDQAIDARFSRVEAHIDALRMWREKMIGGWIIGVGLGAIVVNFLQKWLAP